MLDYFLEVLEYFVVYESGQAILNVLYLLVALISFFGILKRGAFYGGVILGVFLQAIVLTPWPSTLIMTITFFACFILGLGFTAVSVDLADEDNNYHNYWNVTSMLIDICWSECVGILFNLVIQLFHH